MKRGRKQDNTLPPSRSREIQRAFRQRRSDYIGGLELRVVQLEAEVDEILARHNEKMRYATAEVVAARSASRKKQKTKSKHSLAQFVDVNALGEPATPDSPRFPTTAPSNTPGTVSSPSLSPSVDIRKDVSSGSRYLIRDMNGGFSSGSNSPQSPTCPQQSHPASEQEADSRNNNLKSTLSRRGKPLLQLWNAPSKTSGNTLFPHSSITTPSAQGPPGISCHQYSHLHPQIEMYMGMDSVVPTPEMSSQLMSSIVFRSEMRVPPPSTTSLPCQLADSSPQNNALSNVVYNSYNSNLDSNSPSYTYRTSHSQLSDRLNSCSYTFVDSPQNSALNVPGYHHDSPLSLLRSHSSMSDQPNPNSGGSLSTLITIAATRLDRFNPQEGRGYQSSTLQSPSALIESSILSDSVINPHALQDKSTNVPEEYAKSTRTATPCSTSPSESKDVDQQIQYESHPRSNDQISFDDFGGNYNSSCVSFYHQNSAKNWPDENMPQFSTEMYQSVNISQG